MDFLRKCLILTLHICLGGALAAENLVINEPQETYEIATEIKQLKENDTYIRSYIKTIYVDVLAKLDRIQRAKLIANKGETSSTEEEFVDGLALKDICAEAVHISETQAPKLHALIKELADKTQLQIPFVFISFDKSICKIGSFSPSPSLTSIIIGEGLINKLSDKQLKGIIAREFGYLLFNAKNKNSCFDRFITSENVSLTVLACMLSLFFLMRPEWKDIKRPFNRIKNMGALSRILLASPLLAVAIIGYVAYLRNNSLAHGETRADQTAIDITQDPESFVAAMEFLKEINIKKVDDYTNEFAPIEKHLEELKELSADWYNKLTAELKNEKDSINIATQNFLDNGTHGYPGINKRIEHGKREIEKYKNNETVQPIKIA